MAQHPKDPALPLLWAQSLARELLHTADTAWLWGAGGREEKKKKKTLVRKKMATIFKSFHRPGTPIRGRQSY